MNYRPLPSLATIALVALTSLATVPATFAADAPATFKVSEFSFSRPTSWEWVESTSAMRKAQLKVAGKEKEPGEVVFYHFGAGGGGGTQANIDRWLGQFKEPRDQIKAKTEQSKVAGHAVTFVQAEGTYLSGMPGGPKTPQANAMLLGAILESEEGNVFVRMTGPAQTVKDAQPEFRKMIESAKAGK